MYCKRVFILGEQVAGAGADAIRCIGHLAFDIENTIMTNINIYTLIDRQMAIWSRVNETDIHIDFNKLN